MADAPSVLVEELAYRYPDGQCALNGVTFRASRGECVALIGPNGAGKSTLLLHLNGLLRGSGRVTIAGLEAVGANLREVRRRVGLVFQDPDDQLFLPTCLEDVAFGPMNLGLSWPDARDRAMAALAEVGMDGHVDRAPHRLSLGQRKRVAIATVLAMDPEVLALDEPSAGLDPRARRRLIETVRGLDRTRLIATHDLALVEELCRRVIVLDGGEVVADGPTASVLQDDALLARHGFEPTRRCGAGLDERGDGCAAKQGIG